MKTFAKLTTAGAVLVLSGGLAFAECVDTETTASAGASSEAVKTPPIEKDGSTAPLEVEPRDRTAQAGEGDPVQKDGGTMPLASSEQDESTEDLATSQRDIEAQQEGEQTAAMQAEPDC